MNYVLRRNALGQAAAEETVVTEVAKAVAARIATIAVMAGAVALFGIGVGVYVFTRRRPRKNRRRRS
jgi:hypothetical protein